MANLKKYDPKDIIITVGPHIVSGYADGTFVSVARQGDSFSSIAGADGEVARARSNDKRGTITLTLMQTSRTNAYLSGLVAVDEETGNGVVPVTVRNAKGVRQGDREPGVDHRLRPVAVPRGRRLTATEQEGRKEQ